MRRWRQHARRSWPPCDHARSVTMVGVSLSGGRDSGAIALALAEVGVTATCITQ